MNIDLLQVYAALVLALFAGILAALLSSELAK